MKQEIEKELNKLKGYKLEKFTRCVNMGNFIFSDSASTHAFGLHIQCPWRIEIGQSILVANGDMYLPASSYSGEWDDFDWDVIGANFFDEVAETYETGSLYPIYVCSAKASDVGDVAIEFDKNAKITIFTNNSTDQEQWRLLRIDDREEPHFVVSALGVETV